MEPKIVFEDDCLLVLDKPAGWVVNRAKTVKENTLQDWIEKTRRSRLSRSGIVHRLDKETSGLLLVAKTKEAFENLQKQFKERKVKKKYLSLVHGKLRAKRGEIFLPIGRTKKDREKFGVVVEGKKARTKYRILKYYETQWGPLSYLELEPFTGRTHQIRVHLAFLGHPIVADLKYGGKRAKKDCHFFPRMFLHASYLSFDHPRSDKRREFTSPLPSDLRDAIFKICGRNSSLFS